QVRVARNANQEQARITVDGWVKANGSPGTFRYIVAKGDRVGAGSSYALYTGTTGGLSFYIYNTVSDFIQSPVASPAIWDGNWHHVAGSYDGTAVRLYVDGAQVGAGTPTTVAITYGLATTN